MNLLSQLTRVRNKVRARRRLRGLYYRWRFGASDEPAPQNPAQPQPPTVFVDDSGVAWPRHPDYQNADKPDEGQHDVWKKDLRIALWRFLNDRTTPGVLNLEPLGFGRRSESVPVLFPVGEQLAQKCRTLGFFNLAKASMPEATLDELNRFHAANEQAVQVEAQARFERTSATAKSWDATRMGYAYTAPTFQETVQALTLGPFTGASDSAEPLQPIPLEQTTHYSQFIRERKKS